MARKNPMKSMKFILRTQHVIKPRLDVINTPSTCSERLTYIQFTFCPGADNTNTAGANAYFLLVTLGSSPNLAASNIKRL